MLISLYLLLIERELLLEDIAEGCAFLASCRAERILRMVYPKRIIAMVNAAKGAFIFFFFKKKINPLVGYCREINI